AGGAMSASGRVNRTVPQVATGPIAVALDRRSGAYAIHGLRARNPAQQLRATFSPAGMTLHAGPGRARMSLSAWGRPGSVAAMGGAKPVAEATRVTYTRGSVREWYANDRMGFEQGFDVSRRPAGSGPLTLEMMTSGNLKPSLANGSVVLAGRGQRLS